MSYWTFTSNCKRRYDKNRIILARFDYKAHFFEIDPSFFSLFHLFEKGVSREELEQFINKHKSEKAHILAVIRDLEHHQFLTERTDSHV